MRLWQLAKMKKKRNQSFRHSFTHGDFRELFAPVVFTIKRKRKLNACAAPVK